MESITATPTSGASTSSESHSASPTATGPPLPSPTQDGLVGNCTKFHRAVSGDTCGKIISRYKPVTLDQFIEWNPAVEKDCSGLWSGYHYCVGIPGTPSASPTSISASTSRSSTNSHTTVRPAAPGPTQDGIVNNCQRWHKAVSGNTCASLLNQYGTFTLDEFIKWNPAVGEDCSGLWLNYYYCIGRISWTYERRSKTNQYWIGIPGTPTTKKAVPKPTTTGCNSPGLPSPTQPGAICRCSKWHQVRQGDTCDNITRNYRISISKFKEWNPNVGKDCYGLWLRYYVCVGGK